ncbi:hypothetical protein HHI36_008519 [Cryptolaemus montrouzieri]|uniref:Ionotropic glutamate receptor C-terminal domain-containing protein n=1 Tax=Cryptolaemus montrouzieri TaxID=559131 RepID=A0ABD2MTH7_9CUCU
MPLFFTDSRLKWIDYIAPNTMSHLYFIFRDPPLSYVANIFTRPFHRNVWYASFLMLVLIFAIKYVIVKWEWKEAIFRETIEKLHDATKPSVDDIAIVQMGVVSQQGSDTELKSIAGRIAFIFSLICFMFIYTAYSGMILALLQSTSNMITTLDDLLNSGIDLGIEDLMYAVPYFKSNNDPVKTAIYVKKLAPKGDKAIMTLEKGIEKMRTEFFAFHTEQNSAYKVVRDTFQENEKCNLQEIAYFNFIKPWIVATKNHTYKELLKIR